MTWQGKYRVRGRDGNPNRAWVVSRDNNEGFYVEESDYRTGPYSPLWNDLPWA